MFSKHVVICFIIFVVISVVVAFDGITFPRLRQTLSPLNPSNRESTKSLADLSRSSEEFALEFLQHVSRDPRSSSRNFILSPFSVWTILVLLAEGAGGNTYTQLQTVLRLPPDLSNIRRLYQHLITNFQINSTDIELQANQVIFCDENRPIDIGFQYKLENIYDADYFPVNFYRQYETFGKINNYVSERTHGRFKQVVDINDLNQAQMILISAIFFKGAWKFPFSPDLTFKAPFHDEDGNVVSRVDMMSRTGGAKVTKISELRANVMELEYSNDNRLSLIVLLPEEKTRLSKVIDNLRAFGIVQLMDRMSKIKYEEDDVEIFLPRFNVKSHFELDDVLSNMGLSNVFDANRANFTRISSHEVHVSTFIHKSIVEVNEVGTVAAAVSGATLSFTIALPTFTVNRPFAFLIVAKQTNILAFCGQVHDPQLG